MSDPTPTDSLTQLLKKLTSDNLSELLSLEMRRFRAFPDNERRRKRTLAVIDEYKHRYLYFYGWPTGYLQPPL